MQIIIPDELADEAFRLLAQPDHESLTPYVRFLLRREIEDEKLARKEHEERFGHPRIAAGS